MMSKPIDWNNRFSVPYGARRRLAVREVARIEIAFDSINGAKVAPPVRPNAGLQTKIKRQLQGLTRAMHKSVMKWVRACYNANEPEISDLAEDALPASELTKTVRELKRRWSKQYTELSARLAKYYAKDASNRTDAQLQKILKE